MSPITFNSEARFQPGFHPSSQATQTNATSFSTARLNNHSKDSIRFGNGGSTTSAQTDTKKGTWQKAGNWIKKQPQVWSKSIKAAFKLGGLLPTQGIIPDAIWSTAITIPLCILPGAQLFLIPTWIVSGAAIRAGKTLLKGMWNPENVLKPQKT